MANIVIQSSALGTVPVGTEFGTNEIDGAQYQVIKLAYGPSDTATLVREDVPLPVIFADLIEGGIQPYQWISDGTIDGKRVKPNPGLIYSVQVFNTNASPAYIKFFDLDSFPVTGESEVKKTLLIPGSTSGAGFVLSWPKGLAFGHGIGFALTTGIAPDDVSPVDAGKILVNVDYL